jgi:membrane-bound lytic murein transglycosylase D
MNSFITLPFNETVRNYIILYSEKMPTKMGHILGLCRYYMPIFEEIFNKYDMPLELKYMAVIESALNPVAVSRAGAKGMWQFMYKTARDYGLEINSYVDERLDPVASADAAARFLSDSYAIFGDWNPAISSYNCGAGNVNKAIRRAGGNKDFWTIYNYLPKESRGYVPAFVGAMYAFTYYREHGITPEPVALPAHVDTFEIHKMLHFQQISEVVGVPMETLRNLNPQYIHDVIPGTEDTYILRLPYQYTAAFIDNEDSVYVHRAKEIFSPATLENIQSGTTTTTTTSRITYKVKKGDTLGKIASRYHVTINQIKSWNNLRSSNIKIGQRLIIQQRTTTRTPTTTSSSTSSSSQSGTATTAPTPSSTDTTAVKKDTTSTQAADSTSAPSTGASEATEKAAADVKAEIEQADKKAAEQKAAEPEYTVYVVKKGDTLSAIAKRNGLTIKDITSYNNNISTNIKIGQRIKIPRKK